MASRDHPAPLADWFRRNRTRLAWVAWLLLAAGGVPDLLEGTLDGFVDFAYRAVFFGLLSWSWGSSQDRAQAQYWRRFAVGWSILLVVQVALTVLALARGKDFSGGWLVGVGVVLLLAIFYWLPYRRIKHGGAWPPQREPR